MSEIKETKELLVGVLALSTLLTKHLKDGLQAQKDFLAVYTEIQTNEELKQKLFDAYEGYGKVKDEVKSLDLSGTFGLIQAILPEVMKLIEEIKE